jgi:protein subunit release factor A
MRKLLFSVTKKDLEIQTFCSGGKGGSHQNATQSGVRIIHHASGARGESREHRYQKQNKEAAFVRMATSSVFQAWLKVETSRRLMDQHQLHRRVNKKVDQWIAPKNLKVQMLRDGKWIEEAKVEVEEE